MECRYNTDEYADAKAALERKLQLLGLHERAEHTLDPVLSLSVQPATQRRKPKKFPRPTVGLEETREGLDNFRLNWTQYKEDSDLMGADVKRQLVASCSKELQAILSRNLGLQHFETDELVLLKSLEDTVKAKACKGQAHGSQRGGLQGGDQKLFQLQGVGRRLNQGGVPEVARQCGIQGHYKDTARIP